MSAKSSFCKNGPGFIIIRLLRSARSFVRSFVRPFVRSSPKFFVVAKICSTARKFRSGRCDRFRPRIVQIGAILAIFEPFEIRKIHMPLLSEFGRSSQDLRESDYDSIKSRDDRPNSSKSGMWIFGDLNAGHILLRRSELLWRRTSSNCCDLLA